MEQLALPKIENNAGEEQSRHDIWNKMPEGLIHLILCQCLAPLL